MEKNKLALELIERELKILFSGHYNAKANGASLDWHNERINNLKESKKILEEQK